MCRPYFGSLVIAITALGVQMSEAHKPMTSKYTYNDDVFPILQDRCGRCHVSGGVAPMSLLTYKDAVPWAESIRGELIAGHMPPGSLEDGGLAVKRHAPLTPREIDVLLTWATGGTPLGDPLHPPPVVTLKNEWPLGKPDLELPLPTEVSLSDDKSEDVREFVVAARSSEPRWIRAVDLLPGTPSIVRDAVIALKSNPDAVLAMWVPGETPVSTSAGTAFKLPAEAELLVRIHYRKTYAYEGKAMTDRSSVGLYFAKEGATELRAFTVTSPLPLTAENEDRIAFNRVLDEDLRAIGFYADPALTNALVAIDLVGPNDQHTPIARFVARAHWTRRYWFERPVVLARGSRVEVVATINGADALLPPAAAPTPPQAATMSPVRVTFDVEAAR